MSSELLAYATGPRRSSWWRGALRRATRLAAVGLLVAAIVAAAVISNRWPWVWYGSRDAYQWHRWLTFTLPPDRVVYEEDAAAAARLLARPPEPRGDYVGDPSGNPTGGLWDYIGRQKATAMYCPRMFRALMGSQSSSLVFLHARTNSDGRDKLVLVNRGSVFPNPSGRRAAIYLKGRVCPPGSRWLGYSGNGSSIRIPLSSDQVMRIYAGQPDPGDAAHFTIKYEIDNVPGTIDGRLEADDTVTLRVLDGPASTRPSTGALGSEGAAGQSPVRP